MPYSLSGFSTNSSSSTFEISLNLKKNDFYQTEIRVPNKAPPQVYIGMNDQNQQVISLGREAPPIKHLVMQGGGAKGSVYPYFIKILNERMGLLRNLEEVAGSSAGACMAFLIAAGLSLEKIIKLINNLDMFQELSGNDKVDATRHIKLGRGILSAMKLRGTLFKETNAPVIEYYINFIRGNEERINQIEEKYREDFIARAEAGFPKGLTFRDLKILNALNPEQFKLLNVTAYDKEAQRTIYFDAESTPVVSCFEGVVASMSIPVVMKSVRLDLLDGQGIRQLVDGGAGSNVPLEVFSKREGYKPEENMVLIFGNKDSTCKIQYDPVHKYTTAGVLERITKKVCFVFNYIFCDILKNVDTTIPMERAHIPKPFWFKKKGAKYVGVANFYQNRIKDAEKIYSIGPNGLVVPHGDLGSLDFKAGKNKPDRVRAAINQAEAAANLYAELRGRDHLIQHDYKTAQDALDSLTDDELEALYSVADEKIRVADEVMSAFISEKKRLRTAHEKQFFESIKNRYEG